MNAIEDYGLIADGHAAALVGRDGSIDWCCLPRIDAGSCFGRLLDSERGGCFSIRSAEEAEVTRAYEEDTAVLVTTFAAGGVEARVIDCLVLRDAGRTDERRRLLRIVEGVRGDMQMRVHFEPRFDYGAIAAWIRREGAEAWTAVGGDDGLIFWPGFDIEPAGDGHRLEGTIKVPAGERVHLALDFVRPEELALEPPPAPSPGELDDDLRKTIKRWRDWAGRLSCTGPGAGAVRRSALTLKALAYAPTGAIAAAATTSLPEWVGGPRNWDYRFSWIRDSSLASRSFAEVGCEAEADDFRSFIERSAAGHASDVQILYGVGGERRVGEQLLDHLSGYRDSRPVRAGNDASGQVQLDALGELVNLSWRWHRRGHSPDDDHWRFLLSLVEQAAERCYEPDSGIWEWRGEPEHFVHSKVWCWAALDRGVRLADECLRRAPTRRWAKRRDELREAIETKGYDSRRGVFVQTFDRKDLDAALLLLPTVDFVAWDDERMIRTADAVREDLGAGGGGLIYRYRRKDGNPGPEGAFVACSFWLVECLARQQRLDEAREVFAGVLAAANDLGLMSEECHPKTAEALGNFPQALSHLAHIAAWQALQEG